MSRATCIPRTTAMTLALVGLLCGCGGGRPATTTRSTLTAQTPLRSPRASRPPVRPPAPPPAPGSLPQTSQLPSATTAAFRTEMRALWRAIATNSLAAGLLAFFPEAAYAQVKAITDPHSDYVNRLVAEYRLDIAAAHALLGGQPGAAQLVTVNVPKAYAHWVLPGTCFNRVGYYEVPNARLVYRQGAATRSLGIASLISWRGTWYVVHLGAVVRQGAGGVVDDPEPGPGSPAPSSTC